MPESLYLFDINHPLPMSASSQIKSADHEKLQEKRKTRKAAIVFILAVALIFSAIWFGRQFFAKESLLSESQITVNSKICTIKLSEKSSNYRSKNADGMWESGNTHFGYFLELTDHANHTVIDKLKFSSPVSAIQSTPEMICLPNGEIWIVSITNSNDDDRRGFVLKFSVSGNQIVQNDFALDEKYCIRDLEDHKVILSERNAVYYGYNAIFGGIYLDLESGKIMDDRKDPASF